MQTALLNISGEPIQVSYLISPPGWEENYDDPPRTDKIDIHYVSYYNVDIFPILSNSQLSVLKQKIRCLHS